jgi:hypothetical protein
VSFFLTFDNQKILKIIKFTHQNLKKLKRKIPTFVFGLSIGLLVGIGFFVLKINDLFNKLKESASEKITVIEKTVNTTDEDEKTKNNNRFKINFKKSTKINYSEVDSLIKEDSGINIASDELLTVKNIKIIQIGEFIPSKDSSDIQKTRLDDINSDLYFVEFWKTPLNSKGYRFTKNKIMLYGFDDFNNLTLYEIDHSFYIKSSDQVYKLLYSSEFKQLDRVLDSELLAKIN